MHEEGAAMTVETPEDLERLLRSAFAGEFSFLHLYNARKPESSPPS